MEPRDVFDLEAKLNEIVTVYEDLERRLGDPALVKDRAEYQRITRQHNELQPLIAKFNKWKQARQSRDEAQELMKDADADMAAMAKQEYDQAVADLERLENDIRVLLLPRDPMDGKNVYLEIRAGAGGEEAALFAGDLLKMYSRYAELRRWKTEMISASETGLGGYKEVVIRIKGDDVYSRMKYEGGVHRVQRVPETEAQGRIHTSTVTVAVLPEAEEIDVQIKDSDLRIDVFHSSGPGGQSVNTSDSAVRITHLPTNTVVQCQDERSQLKNRIRAMAVLRARLYEMEQRKREDAQIAARRGMVGSGDRSEKIRTYNFPENRLTDHRIGLRIHSLDSILNGELDQVIDPMILHVQTEQLKASGTAT